MNRREIGKTGRGLAGLLPLAAVILGINVAVDPAHVTGLGSYERSVAAILEEGRGAAGAANFDERLVQIDLASRLTHPAGTLVLGSSRMMALSGRSLGTSDLRNAAVASATLEDLVALYHLYTRSTGLPARVLVGVDPWTLRPNPGMQGWHSFGNAYVEACIALGQVSCSAPPFNSPLRRAVAALLSPSYFQRSIDVLLSRVGSGGRPISSLRVASEETAYPDEFVRRADGSIRYPRSYGKDQERALEAARMLGQ